MNDMYPGQIRVQPLVCRTGIMLPYRCWLDLPITLRDRIVEVAGGLSLQGDISGWWRGSSGMASHERCVEMYCWHDRSAHDHVQSIFEEVARWMLNQGEEAVLISQTDSYGRVSAGLVTKS